MRFGAEFPLRNRKRWRGTLHNGASYGEGMSDTDMNSGAAAGGSEPAFDAPPLFAAIRERRLHARVHHHWASLRRSDSLPTLDAFDPALLNACEAQSLLVELGTAPQFVHIGERLWSMLDSLPSDALMSQLAGYCAAIRANGRPIDFEAETPSRHGTEILYRGILLPLASRAGAGPDRAYGILTWKEAADAAIVADLARAIGRAAGVCRAGDGPATDPDPWAAARTLA